MRAGGGRGPRSRVPDGPGAPAPPGGPPPDTVLSDPVGEAPENTAPLSGGNSRGMRFHISGMASGTRDRPSPPGQADRGRVLPQKPHLCLLPPFRTQRKRPWSDDPPRPMTETPRAPAPGPTRGSDPPVRPTRPTARAGAWIKPVRRPIERDNRQCATSGQRKPPKPLRADRESPTTATSVHSGTDRQVSPTPSRARPEPRPHKGPTLPPEPRTWGNRSPPSDDLRHQTTNKRRPGAHAQANPDRPKARHGHTSHPSRRIKLGNWH